MAEGAPNAHDPDMRLARAACLGDLEEAARLLSKCESSSDYCRMDFVSLWGVPSRESSPFSPAPSLSGCHANPAMSVVWHLLLGAVLQCDWPALVSAAEHGSVEMVRLLLDCGANLEAMDFVRGTR